MKLRKMQFPVVSMLLFSMVVLCGVIISGLMLASQQYSIQAKQLTDATTILRSSADCYLSSENFDSYCLLMKGDNQNSTLQIQLDNQLAVSENGQYMLVVKEQKQDKLYSAHMQVYVKDRLITEITVDKSDGGNSYE